MTVANYCSNLVSFTGKNSDGVLAYFQSLGKDAPPFLDISINGDTVSFQSRWIPPLRELNRIAEQFDVSYWLQYLIPGEDRTSFEYICLQHQALEPAAEKVLEIINKTETKAQLKEAEELVGDLLQNRTFDLRELGIFASLLKKRANQLAVGYSRIPAPWESDDQSKNSRRGR